MEKFKVILYRFVRGFVASAVSAMILVIPNSTTSWQDFQTWTTALAIAGMFGGMTGALLALDKFFRFEDKTPQN
jgi:uncharacterized membrane protein